MITMNKDKTFPTIGIITGIVLAVLIGILGEFTAALAPGGPVALLGEFAAAGALGGLQALFGSLLSDCGDWCYRPNVQGWVLLILMYAVSGWLGGSFMSSIYAKLQRWRKLMIALTIPAAVLMGFVINGIGLFLGELVDHLT